METTSSALYSWLLRRLRPIGRGRSRTVPGFSTASRYQLSSVSGSRVMGWISLLRACGRPRSPRGFRRSRDGRRRWTAGAGAPSRAFPLPNGCGDRKRQKRLHVGVRGYHGDDAFRLAHVELDVAGDLADELKGVAGGFALQGARGDERPQNPQREKRQHDHGDEGEQQFRPYASESQTYAPGPGIVLLDGQRWQGSARRLRRSCRSIAGNPLAFQWSTKPIRTR